MTTLSTPPATPSHALANGALALFDILSSDPEAAFDALAERAAEVISAPMAGISFFDTTDSGEPCEWFKACKNLPAASFTKDQSFFWPLLDTASPPSSPAAAPPSHVVITDMLTDKRHIEHPWVVGPPHVCFYAATGIVLQGQIIGTLSVFDSTARDITADELNQLAALAALAAARLEARLNVRQKNPTPPIQPSALSAPDEALAPQQRSQQLALQLRHLEALYEDEIVARWKVTHEWRQEKAFSEATIESLPGIFFMLDRDGAVARWNQRFAQITALSESEIRGQLAWNFVIEKDAIPLQEWISRLFATNDALVIETELCTRQSSYIPYMLQGRTVVIKGIPYCMVMGRDISERRQVEVEIRRAKQRLDLALAGSNLVMWDWDLVTDKVYFSENWHTVLGVKPAAKTNDSKEVLGWNHPDDTQRFQANMTLAIKGSGNHLDCEYRIPGIHDEWVWIHTRGKVTERDAQGRARRMTGTSVNVTKRKMAEERVEFLATRDPLTGLPNRMLANDRLEQGIIQAARKRSRLAFMFIDLDRFKTINDSLGHDVGDELLKRVAARLLACVRASDTVARLGGDEFAVIVENLPNEEQGGAQNVAEKMIASLASPVMINGQHLNTSCSIGISLFPNDGSDTQTLMKHADVAMYDAKARGRNNYQFFSHEMNARAQERHSIENFLRLALRRNELTLHYQPRISFSTGQITAVEALLRWQHPRYGLLLPEKFLGIAEDAGLTTPIGEWIIQSAFAQVSAWQKLAGFPLKLALNIAPSQIFDGQRLIRTIDLAAQSTGLDLHRVELELTESTLIKNGADIAALLNSLAARGIRLSIDDFGTGYSSLSSLKQLPVKSIKVDPSFVRDIGTDPNDEAVIRAIIAMSHSLKIDVIAEGVENEEQYRVLRDLQCDEYQGYFYTKPLPAAEFEARLRHTGTAD